MFGKKGAKKAPLFHNRQIADHRYIGAMSRTSKLRKQCRKRRVLLDPPRRIIHPGRLPAHRCDFDCDRP